MSEDMYLERKSVSSVAFQVSYSRGKSLLNFWFWATMPCMGFFRLLKMLATSARRSIRAEASRPSRKTSTMEPPNISQLCKGFSFFSLILPCFYFP